VGAREVKKIRAFVAIRVSPEVQRNIEDLIGELRNDHDGIKWASSGNLHLTLKFLGPAIPIEKVHRLQPELEAIAVDTAPFQLEAAGVGGFPDLKHPHVLWVGLRSDALLDLAARIDDAASRVGFEREQRAFRGHLTIARLKRPLLYAETRTHIEAAATRDFGASIIREMMLYRSITAPTGPIYEVLAKFQFKSPT
jgi:2'-5' RNA ligase